MPFVFLKYLQPTHYFQLRKKKGCFIFPQAELLPNNIVKQLEKDAQYQSKLAQSYDLSWQAIQKGYIGDTPGYTHFDDLTVQDNYRFIRKNFNKVWVFYVFLLRLFGFKNPIKEIIGFFKTRKVNRVNYSKSSIVYTGYSSFNSEFLEREPLVSVVIPTLNRYEYLKDVLRDLECQTYSNFEVIVVDQTELFQVDFYNGWKLNLRYWQQKEKALWRARNEAIKAAKGDYVLLYDDDSLIEPDWILEHLKVLDYFNADISSGVSLSVAGAKIPENYSLFRVSDQIDTGNVLIKKEVFKKIGLFDEQFEKERMGDGEFGLRAYLYGLKNVSNPFAKRLHLKVRSGGLREMGSWDAFRPKKMFSPRPIPSVLYFYRKYFGNRAARFAMLKIMPSSIIPYKYKRKPYIILMGSLFSILISPIILFQINRSWQLASKKLQEGHKIDKLGDDRD